MIELIVTYYCKFLNKKNNEIDYSKFKTKQELLQWKSKIKYPIINEWIEWLYIIENKIYKFNWDENTAALHNENISKLDSKKNIKKYFENLNNE
jgi:hypothetical protein